MDLEKQLKCKVFLHLIQVSRSCPWWLKQDANGCDNDIAELRGHQQMLNQQLDNKQREFHELQSMADTQDGDIERLVELKQKVNMAGSGSRVNTS